MKKHGFREIFLQVADGALGFAENVRMYCAFWRMEFGALRQVIVHPSRIRWNTFAYAMDVCGSNATPIISLLGFLIGVILAFQAIIQLGRYGVQSYVVNLVGTVIVTELAPLVTAVVLAGRTGSSFAAELGSMKNQEEIDALTTFGIDYGEFLVLPRLLALLVVTPGLTIISDMCGIVGGLATVCGFLDITVPEYFAKTFEVIQVGDIMQGMIKSVFFGLIVASVGCMKGLNAQRNSTGVGESTTSAVVVSIFLIVVSDAIITAFFGFMQG